MLIEEEEEEIDEDASIGGLEDVEKFINEDDESDVDLDEDEVQEVLRLRGNKNDKKFQKRDFVEGLENHRNRRRPLQRGDSARKWKS